MPRTEAQTRLMALKDAAKGELWVDPDWTDAPVILGMVPRLMVETGQRDPAAPKARHYRLTEAGRAELARLSK